MTKAILEENNVQIGSEDEGGSSRDKHGMNEDE